MGGEAGLVAGLGCGETGGRVGGQVRRQRRRATLRMAVGDGREERNGRGAGPAYEALCMAFRGWAGAWRARSGGVEVGRMGCEEGLLRKVGGGQAGSELAVGRREEEAMGRCALKDWRSGNA